MPLPRSHLDLQLHNPLFLSRSWGHFYFLLPFFLFIFFLFPPPLPPLPPPLPFYCWFRLTFEKGSGLKLTTRWGMALIPIFLHSLPQYCYYRPLPPHPVPVVLEIKPRAPTNEASTPITELQSQHCFACFEAEPHTVA